MTKIEINGCSGSVSDAAYLNGSVSEIRESLIALSDGKYRDFQARLMPDIAKETIIGVRVPLLRKRARELWGSADAESFLNALPHRYYDENNLHAFLIEREKSFARAVELTDAFLPYVDNWATCDMMSPPVFRKNIELLIGHIRRWIASGKTYSVRFGVGLLMSLYLDGSFRDEYSALVASVKCDDYYVMMSVAWYFATALAKRYEEHLPYIAERRLDSITHAKAIRKACESNRVSDAQKRELKAFLC